MPAKPPKKPYKDFPLFPHASGQWAKKIRGRTHYFGVWNEPDQAIENYLKKKDYLQPGKSPPVGDDQIKLFELCNEFLTAKQNRVDSGELSLATLHDYTRNCDLIIKTLGKLREVNSIGPNDFTKLRSKITERYGPVRSAKEITQARTLFTWGFKQAFCDAPRFGAEFVKPTKEVLRRHRQKSLPRVFEADEIRAMLKIANVHTQAWILLGINCGFIQRDLSDLPVTAVDLDNAIIDFPRGKTAVERRCPLWPETVAALKASAAKRWTSGSPELDKLFFVSRQGNELVRDLSNKTRSDAVHSSINRLQTTLKIKRERRSYGALRHTFRTIADESRDFPAILRIMGHCDNSISDHYREWITDDRLKAVAKHVRQWLYL